MLIIMLFGIVFVQAQKQHPTGKTTYTHFPVAIKTNLLYDIAGVPNLGVEAVIKKSWTIGLNYMHAWWSTKSRNRYWRIYGGDIYARKYLGEKANERNFTGHHLGLYGQALTYDFEWGKKGIMGGIPGGNIFDKLNYGGGIEYGYSHPIARHLNLDFSLSLGYFGGEYIEYEPIDGYYVWMATKQRHYWGPTKAEISLVWYPGKVKKGGIR